MRPSIALSSAVLDRILKVDTFLCVGEIWMVVYGEAELLPEPFPVQNVSVYELGSV